MKTTRRVLVAGMLAAAAGAPLVKAATAQSSDIDVWVETAATHPAVGCVVDTSIEVRAGGTAFSGAEVTLTLSEDGDGTIYSTSSGVTNDSGIVWLTFDTSSAYHGAKTWLEVTVNGSYIGGQTVWVDGDTCSGTGTLLDLSGSAAVVTPQNGAEQSTEDSSSGGEVIIPGVPEYQQQRPLSCEYAAVAIATGALGSWVSEYDIEAVTPLSDNPHWGYRGNINGTWGNTTDYGIYADALVPGLNQFGFQAHSFYGDDSDLMAEIDKGRPTIVWLGMWGDLSHDEYTSDGTRYQVTTAMHVMVAYGYDDGGVYVSDPGSGRYRYYDWGTFNGMWNVMDGMALGIYW